jgi:integrase
VGNTINKIRIVFNYAFKNGLLARPMVYGEGFKRPSKKAIRKHRQAQGPRMFEAREIRAMLDKATLPLRTMLLLGINAGFGNSDVGNLPINAVDLDGGWITYPRPKTAIERNIPLWPETVQALREWLSIRPEPIKEDHKGLMFITSHGGSWAKETNDNPVSKETAKLLKGLKINGHRNFYTLRHTFQTIADEATDFIATRKIMGHASNDIADVYRERVSGERLRKVTEHVRAWLFNDPAVEGEEPDVVKFPAKIG